MVITLVMRQFHVIVQSKQDYYNEQYLRLRFVWWIISSVLFTSLFYVFIKSLSTLWWIFLGFILLFIFTDLSKNERMKVNVQVFFGALYAIWGLLFLVISLFYLEINDERIFGFILTAIFFVISYKKIKRYTNLFEIMFKK